LKEDKLKIETCKF